MCSNPWTTSKHFLRNRFTYMALISSIGMSAPCFSIFVLGGVWERAWFGCRQMYVRAGQAFAELPSGSAFWGG